MKRRTFRYADITVKDEAALCRRLTRTIRSNERVISIRKVGSTWRGVVAQLCAQRIRALKAKP